MGLVRYQLDRRSLWLSTPIKKRVIPLVKDEWSLPWSQRQIPRLLNPASKKVNSYPAYPAPES